MPNAADEDIIKENLQSVYFELNRHGLKVHAGFIRMSIESINKGDPERMLKLITSAEVIGGSGSIVDLDLGTEFDAKFFELMKSIKRAGANNKRLDRTIELLIKLESRRETKE